MKKRVIEIESVLKRKSIFLFGPRQTGKSTWLKNNFPNALYINLLSKKVYDDYLIKPNALESDIEIFKRKNKSNIIIIDEIQKIPQLLDEVHNQIEINKELKFILTGSSARKLKRSGANLLGGRASWKNMFPYVYPEISDQLKSINDLEKRLLFGGIPGIFDSEDPISDFDDYISIYLNEEIKAEGFVRNYEAFNRFLIVAGLSNSKQINFSEVANDCQIPPRTVHDYFQVLEDTLIGFMLYPFKETVARKTVSSSKFYLFDTGLSNALVNRTQLNFATPEAGDIFEQFIILEIRAYISYTNKKMEMSYWRTTSKIEVDLIIKNESTKKLIAIEIKSKTNILAKDFKGLEAISEEFPEIKKIIVANVGRHSVEPNLKIELFPWVIFLQKLWSHEIF